MPSFEKQMVKHLDSSKYLYKDNCASTTKIDFAIAINQRKFSVDVKEKRQKYKSHWTDKIPEQHLFIIDDLAARKIFMDSPYSAIIVSDANTNKFYIFDALTLFLMPKIRVNRRLSGGSLKGKWLVDFRNAEEADTLGEVLDILKEYVNFCEDGCTKMTECCHQFRGEELEICGTTRTNGQRQHDFNNK